MVPHHIAVSVNCFEQAPFFFQFFKEKCCNRWAAERPPPCFAVNGDEERPAIRCQAIGHAVALGFLQFRPSPHAKKETGHTRRRPLGSPDRIQIFLLLDYTHYLRHRFCSDPYPEAIDSGLPESTGILEPFQQETQPRASALFVLKGDVSEGIEYRLLARLGIDCAESLLTEYQSAMLDTPLVVNEGGFGYVPTLPALPPVQFCPPFLVRPEFGQQLLYLD